MQDVCVCENMSIQSKSEPHLTAYFIFCTKQKPKTIGLPDPVISPRPEPISVSETISPILRLVLPKSVFPTPLRQTFYAFLDIPIRNIIPSNSPFFFFQRPKIHDEVRKVHRSYTMHTYQS